MIRSVLLAPSMRVMRPNHRPLTSLSPLQSPRYTPPTFKSPRPSSILLRPSSAQPPQDSKELTLTPGEKVVAGTRLLFWTGALGLTSLFAYTIGKELLPTQLSPNTVFDSATNLLRSHEEVKRRFGTFKTYGRDHGGHREGRRNFIEHTRYTAEDGTERTRVRFNLEGEYGGAFVFAEVSGAMPRGEFVYVLVQDRRNGAVVSVVDNRSVLLARQLAGGSREGMDVFNSLLGVGGKKD